MADAMAASTSLPQETLEYFAGDDLRARVFHDKYALRDIEGNVIETKPPQMWARIARELASVEATPEKRTEWEQKFYWLLDDFRFIPGGRIMHGAGNPKRVTLLNCYVIPVIDDSIESIFEWMKQAARTYSLGGGVGTDISVLRPRGARVNNSARSSSGSVSFMELFSLTTGTIGQSGRRGALMITIEDNHPDILDFIKVKRNRDKVRFANISVRVSDEFMEAVEHDRDWHLRFANDKATVEKTVKARDVWNELIKGARDFAEPGLVFWGTTLRWSTSEYNGMGVITTNPCSEIPLEPYGNCCLGNLNLAQFVTDQFLPTTSIDWYSLERALRYATRFLDNVLDYNADKHPLTEQRDASLRSRRIGVGFTGLGDMLIKLGLKYDTKEAVNFVDEMFDRIKNIVYDESASLAAEKGTFPAYDADQHLRGLFLTTLKAGTLEKIKQQGMRNVACLTVPPVGSGAALSGVTSGIEPIFDLSYIRRSESLSQETFKVYHPLVREYMALMDLESDKDLPATFVPAHQIKAEMRVEMQATIQRHIDHAISSTVNVPKDTTPEEVEQIYFLAWKKGCKGITVYREDSREGILLTEKQATAQGITEQGEAPDAQFTFRRARPRPKKTFGATEQIKTPRGRIYVIVNKDKIGVAEVFVHSRDLEADGLGRMVSLALRLGGDPREVIEQLWRVESKEVEFDRSLSGTVVRVTTVAQGIALAMGRSLYGDDFRPDKAFPKADTLPAPTNGNQEDFSPAITDQPGRDAEQNLLDAIFIGVCPECGASLVNENGCATCRSCGFSKC